MIASARSLPALLLLLIPVCGAAQELNFKALQERFGYEEQDPPANWKDGETGAKIFNIAFNSDGAVRGPNSLPGHAELPMPLEASKVKITLKFDLGSNGVAAVTLTSQDGKQRLRFHEDKRGIALSWRDRTVAEEAVKFRELKTSPVDDHRTLELVVDMNAGQIELSDADTVDVVKGKENGAPDIQIGELQKVIASVEGGAVLRELKIEEL